MKPIAALGAALVFVAAEAHAGTAFVVENLDQGTGVGFDDPAPRQPIGGNTGTTLGQQRLLAFQHALDIWGEVLTSDQEIAVSATMFDLTGGTCDGGGLVLGQAGPETTVLHPLPNGGGEAWHPVALANALLGEDSDPDFPDIGAEFNTALDEGCVPGRVWYYGLDGRFGEDADFVTVVLHEVGHGLGFTSFTNEDGSLIGGYPDRFSSFQFDLDAGKSWLAMTDLERGASILNPRGLVWTGEHTQAALGAFLSLGHPELLLSPPIAGLAGHLSEQVIGPRLPAAGVSGTLVLPDPVHGCADPSNAAQITGNIVLVDTLQGGDACFELQAVVYMEAYGARAVLSIDPTAQDPPEPIWGEYGPDVPAQQIPVFQVTVGDGALLAAAAGSSVSLTPDATRRVGTDELGRPYLFASIPLTASSISHWDTFTRQNLLMEPTLTPDIVGTDVTRYFLQDLGYGICGDGELAGDEECDDGNTTANDGCDPSCKEEVCGDGTVNQDSEECDDGNTTANDGCGPACKEEVCGDGIVNQLSENCDDGNVLPDDGCGRTCGAEICGDGIVQASEACDDENSTPSDGCENDCTVSPKAAGGTGGGAAGSGGASAGSAGSAGSGASGRKRAEDDGCFCRAGQQTSGSGPFAWLVAAALLLGLTRRRALLSSPARALDPPL